MNQKFWLLCLAFGVILSSCAGKAKDYQYMSETEYQNRPALSRALVNPAEPLSEAAVQKILSSKVVLPKRISLAVVRLSDAADGVEFQTVDQEVAEQFYQLSNWGPRVQSVIPVPQLLLAKPVTLASLRQAAVLLQADELLVIKPMSYGNWKFEVFKSDLAKGVTSLEVLLLDTRTSVIPFTSVVTEAVELSREDKDYSNFELMSRAKKKSEANALLKVAPAVKKFFASLP